MDALGVDTSPSFAFMNRTVRIGMTSDEPLYHSMMGKPLLRHWV
jgi:hypothetical protein